MFTRERLTRWTTALRKNPEQQHKGSLTNKDGTKFCCLGKLCQVESLKREGKGFTDETGDYNASVLPPALTKEFGAKGGSFKVLNMPSLLGYLSAVEANDRGVPWPVIAKHFDNYYPCSDER